MKGQPGYKCIALGRDMPYLFKMYSDSNKYLSETDIIEIIKILIGNIVVIDACLLNYITMGTYCAPLVIR